MRIPASLAVFLSLVFATASVGVNAQHAANRNDTSGASTTLGPDGRIPVDFFHPDHQPDANGKRPALPVPAFGGRAIVHLEAMPRSLCYPIENSGVTRRVLHEVHETLLQRDWDTCELKPDLCRGYDVEDTLVLRGGRGADNANIRVGHVTETSDGYRIVAKEGAGAREFKKADVERLERSTVFTFKLRDDVHWHDGHAFDARDVVFSAGIYKNKSLDCGEKRFQFEKIVQVEALDAHTVRFFYEAQYFQALASIGDLCILPAHLYDLSNPETETLDSAYFAKKRAENKDWKPSEKDRADYIAQNPHNRAWVGLGPYKITHWDADSIDAERFEGYFDRANAGYLDAIRWRFVQRDDIAFQALLNGELDVFTRLSAADYFGEATQKPAFTDHFYKGYVYSNAFGYTAWNLQREKFADVRVREALARSFDFDEFKRTFYMGLAVQVTGHLSFFGCADDHPIEPFAFDVDKAKSLLTDAGWYDRDGDGVIDKDGTPFDIELLSNAGNKVSEQFAAKLQESLSRVGIRMKFTALEWAALQDRRKKGEFDALALAWTLPYEVDPEPMWHSKWAARQERSANYTGLSDPAVDALIERGQRELDAAKRGQIWRELQARVYALQPYLFGFNAPKKFAVNKNLRGVQTVKLDPNYVIRRWYYAAGTPGTRATLEKTQ